MKDKNDNDAVDMFDNEPSPRYMINNVGDHAYEVYSIVDTSFGGVATNYIATETSYVKAKNLINRFKKSFT